MTADPKIAWFGFTGMIEPGGVGRIAGALNAAVNSGVETVHLSFSSNGGYVADGISLHNHIRAMFMVHPTTMGSAEGMSARRLQSTLDAALADDDRTDNILRQYSAIPEDVLAARRHSEVHISPRQAVEFGLVQGVREFALPKGQHIVQI